MKQSYKNILIVIAILVVVIPAYAFQPGPGAPGNSGPPPPPGFAIDGFLSIFLAIGAWFGVKSIKNKK
jgi:hypothetical protein